MARVKRGVAAHAKHKKTLKLAKGYYGRRKNTIRIAKQAVEKAMQYNYRDRKVRKRNFRALWIQRINAATREHGMTYGRFIHGLSEAGIALTQNAGTPRVAHELRGTLDHAVTLTRLAGFDLAGRGHLEALLGATLGLQLGHFASLLFKYGLGNPNTHLVMKARGLRRPNGLEGVPN